ncbi:hypothetical protein B1689_11870 [Geobacillus sp. 44C]|nr:hypothetical protein B1689_11870 [Geobacillus sp. 44C]
MKLNYPHLPAKAGGSGGFLFPLSVVAQRPQAPLRSFMTEEERFSTIKLLKKQKMPIHPPPTLRLEVGVFSAKKRGCPV